MTTQLSILVNSSEAFKSKGTGISSFAKNLVATLSAKDKIELLLDTTSSQPSDILVGSNLFNVHEPSTSSIDYFLRYFRDKFSLSTNSQIKLTSVPSNDQLIRVAIKKFNPNISPCFDNGRTHSMFWGGKRISNISSQRFSAQRSLTSLCLKLPKCERAKMLFHNPSPSPIILKGVKNICTVHDLIPITHPELCLSNPSYEYDLLSKLISKYDFIHFISHFTANSAYNIFGSRLREKSMVITQPISNQTYQIKEDADFLVSVHRLLYKKFLESGDGSLIQVGTLEPKKNHLCSIEAFLLLKETYPRLRFTIIGKEGWLCSELINRINSLSKHGVEWINYVSRDHLSYLLSKSLAFIFPSIIEGWGLPPVEAMALGTPAIVSNIPACKEACGEGSLYIDQHQNPLVWAKTIAYLLSSESIYIEWVTKGLQHSRLQSQEDYFDKLHRMYKLVHEN